MQQIIKALLVRSHPSALAFAQKLFDLFSDVSVNWDAAKGIGLIPGNDSILTKQNHAVVKILYAQKYVGAILPQTIAGSVDASGKRYAKSTQDSPLTDCNLHRTD